MGIEMNEIAMNGITKKRLELLINEHISDANWNRFVGTYAEAFDMGVSALAIEFWLEAPDVYEEE
tara:strand:- start:91 stop:285 length:195 start_codon:yes stop_codon:yes gene_type:complete